MSEADQVVDGPVTFVATRHVKRDRVEDYRKWVSDLGDAARAMDPGFRMTVIEPGGSKARQYVLVLYFSDHDKLTEWEECDDRKTLLKSLQPLVEGKATFSEVTGFEYWFALPEHAGWKPPPRYKMALVTIVGLYMLSVTYTYTINKWLDALPDHAALIVRIVVLVVLMTFILMPILTRVFSRWLYPAKND